MSFDRKSRHAASIPYAARDRAGREVVVVPPAEPPAQALAGWHPRTQGQRLDHLAARYLGDPAGYWRIAELADAMLPAALAESDRLPIPRK